MRVGYLIARRRRREMKKVYLIGSLRNPAVPELANEIRTLGFDVFDDWFAGGPEADDYWQKYEKGRGRTYVEALHGYVAPHIFGFDKIHIDASDIGILMLPAGKSGHLELGYMAGSGKLTYILLPEEPERFDVMYKFATDTFIDKEVLFDELRRLLATPSFDSCHGCCPWSVTCECDEFCECEHTPAETLQALAK